MSNFIHLEGDCLHIKGATKIISSTQTQAVVETSESGIIITGTEIEVKKLNLDEQEVIIGGKFTNLKLGSLNTKKTPLLKRIFKWKRLY